MNPVLHNPIRERLEELAQSYNQELRSIAAYQQLANSATHAIARQDVSLIANVLESSDTSPFVQDVEQKLSERFGQGFSPDDMLRAIDALEHTVASRVTDPQTQRLMWETFSQSRSLVVREASQRLEISERRFRQIVDTAPLGMHFYQLEADGRLVFTGANPAADAILKTEHSQFIGKTIEEAFPGLKDTLIPDIYRRAAASGEPWQTDQVLYDEGQIAGAYEVRAFQAGPGRMVASFLDITERKRAEEALRQAQERSQAVVDAIPDMIFRLDREGVFIDFKAEKGQELLLPPEAFLGKRLEEVMPPNVSAAARESMERAYQSGEAQTFEYELTFPDGVQHFEARMLVSPSQEAIALIRNITERKQAEDVLRRYAAVVEVSGQAVFTTTVQGVIQDWNPAAERMFGYTADEIIGQSIRMLTLPDQAGEAKQLLQQVSQGEPVRGVETVRLAKDGRRVDVLLDVSPILGAQGEVVALSAMLTDITERKRVEAEREQLQTILESTSDLVAIAMPDGKLTYMNAAGRRMIGWGEGEDIRSHAIPEAHPEWAQRLVGTEGIPVAIQEGVWQGETAVLGADGVEIPVSQVIVAHKSEGGQLQYLSSVMRDISERKKVERALLESESRLRRLSEVAMEGVVFHEMGVIFDANPVVATMFGLDDVSAVFGRNIMEFIAPEEHQFIFEHMRSGSTATYESVGLRKDGTRFPVEAATSAYELEGRTARVTFLRDITERKQAEEALRQSQERNQVLVDAIPDMIFRLDREGVFIDFKAEKGQELLLPPQAFLGKRLEEVMPPNVSAAARESMERAYQSGEVQMFEYELVLPDGVQYFEARMLVSPSQEAIAIIRNITGRKQAERIVLQERDFSDAVINGLPGIFYLFDTTGRLVRWNKNYEDVVGYSSDELAQRSALDAIAVEDRERTGSVIQKIFAEGQTDSIEAHVLTRGGTKIPYYFTGIRMALGDEFYLTGMGIDITERKRLEDEIRHALERRGYQVRVGTLIAQEIAAAPDLRVIFDRVVTLVKEQFGYYHTQILRYEPALDAVLLIAGYGEIGRQMLAVSHQLPMGIGLIGTAAATGETMMRPVLRNDPDWKPNPLLPDTVGEIAVPIKLRDQVLGVLDVQSDREGALGEDDRLLLEGLCGQIAVAIEDTRLRREMEDRIRELNALYQASAHEGWRTFRETVTVGGAYLYDHLEVQQIEDLPFTASGDRYVAGVPVSDDGGYEFRENMSDESHLAAVVNPLAVRGEVIGLLGVYEDPAHPLSDDDRMLVDEVAEQVSQALDGARLFEQTQTALAETQALYAGSALIISARTLDDVIQALLKNTRLNEMDQVIIELFDRPWTERIPDVMMNAAVWERSGRPSREPVGTTYSLSEFPFLGLLDREKPLVVEDVVSDGRVDEYTRQFVISELGVRGLAFWPLIAGGQWFGALAGQSGLPMIFSTDDLRQISSLVAQSATVIQSLRLQEDMRERVRELTNLQRLMSREAWTTYQSQTGAERLGYLFNRVNTVPLDVGSSLHPGDGGQLLDKTTGLAGLPGLATPLQVRGEPIGILGVHPDADRVLSPDEESFLQAISEQVAQAMERARLMEQTQKSAVELQAVAEVGTATATILEPGELLQQVVDLTKERFGLYHAHVYLVDEFGSTLVLSAGAGEVGRNMTAEGWSISVDDPDSLVARAAQTRRGQMIADVRREANYLPNPSLPNTLSELAVPLIIADRLLGIFDVQSDTANRFTEEDLRTYRTLSAQITVALQNAKLYAEQLSAVERLRELDNMKTAFMANMSHELRTPLNSILGFTQVIIEGLDGPITDLMVSDLELIEKNGKHLLNLINEILDMAKIEAGRLSLNPEPLNLFELLEDVVVTTGPLVRDKGLYLNLDADPMGDWVVMADHVRMRQILINIVGNAIKFTDKGGITVEIDKLVSSSVTEDDRVQVRIRDTGIGIPRAKLEDVFEAFTQVDSSTTRKAGGTGLGLPISRRLIELHGGRLWAESEGPGKGSTFSLELPVGKNPSTIVE